MDSINLCCPGCKAHLTLPADKANNDKLLLVCPKCNFSGNPASYIRMQPPNPSNQQRSGNDVIDPTVVVGYNLQNAMTIGRLMEVKSQTVYQLKQGLNRFGRKATNSDCEHQFANNDTFISRKHFEVNVIFNKSSLVYNHRLQDLDSRNGTKINGLKLFKGDVILLKQGDRLLAGKTELIFGFTTTTDETTLA